MSDKMGNRIWILGVLFGVILMTMAIKSAYDRGHTDGWTKAFTIQQDYYESRMVGDKTHEWLCDPETGEAELRVKNQNSSKGGE